MPDKEKTKIHLFAGILHPDEEILWMSPPISTRIATKSNPLVMSCFYIAIYGLLVALIVSVCAGVLILGNDLLTTVPIAIAALIVLGTASLFIAGLIDQKPYKLVDHTYAVTNERLLYGSTKKMDSLPLENLPTITLLERTQGRGILSFGGLYLLWPEMEDAAEIKEIIEVAKKQRVQTIEHA